MWDAPALLTPSWLVGNGLVRGLARAVSRCSAEKLTSPAGMRPGDLQKGMNSKDFGGFVACSAGLSK
jgi:hypothetical protein